jgi:uncharacterized membrane protein YhaH (DUF805 family)
MSFQDAVRTCLSKYVDFSGRARRSEYWWFFLFSVIVGIVAGIIDGIIKTPILGILCGLALLLPGLAVSIRRLHDTSKVGWWLLIDLIPCVGFIVLLIFFVTDSHGDNQYGPSPKGGGAATGGGVGYGQPPSPYGT